MVGERPQAHAPSMAAADYARADREWGLDEAWSVWAARSRGEEDAGGRLSCAVRLGRPAMAEAMAKTGGRGWR